MNKILTLSKQTNVIKSQLRHDQLKNGTYFYNSFKKEISLILHAYKTQKSIYKAASSVGVDGVVAMKWYSEGMLGNPIFRGFYLGINEINNAPEPKVEDKVIKEDNSKNFQGDFKISQYGDGWSYTTYVDGEKIFIISNELNTLKEKVKSKKLPLN